MFWILFTKRKQVYFHNISPISNKSSLLVIKLIFSLGQHFRRVGGITTLVDLKALNVNLVIL